VENMSDKERLVLIEHLAKIEDYGDYKTVEINFDDWAWLMDLAEETLNK
jgi:hypothetical protein